MRSSVTALVAALCFVGLPTFAAGPAGNSFPVNVHIDAGETLGELEPIWRFFGADEPNYATMKDGEKLLESLGELKPGAVYFRAHNLLTSGDGTPALKWGSTNAYTEDDAGNPVYDWTIVDRIFDTYLERGVRPYVEIGFMPRALSRDPDPYAHEWRPGLPYGEIFAGWASPPRDYGKWEELVYRWVRHCLERYGKAEVATWYWETWNEANIGYWRGTPDEFLKLHDAAVAAVRRALPGARVGGPDMAGSDPRFLRAFLEHCLKRGTPLDFVAFHAKGAPTYVDGHVRMGIAAQLATIDRGFATIASFPELK
jgi:xylan 1,4-beta-xylosidase